MSQVLEGLSCKNVVYHVHCTGISGAEGKLCICPKHSSKDTVKSPCD